MYGAPNGAHSYGIRGYKHVVPPGRRTKTIELLARDR